jgi:hypothetical protein
MALKAQVCPSNSNKQAGQLSAQNVSEFTENMLESTKD